MSYNIYEVPSEAKIKNSINEINNQIVEEELKESVDKEKICQLEYEKMVKNLYLNVGTYNRRY